MLQPSLLQPEGFQPVRHGTRHYVAVLQNKPGELQALRHASDETWEHLAPLLHFVGPGDPQRPLRADTIDRWTRNARIAIANRPCFVDLLRLKPGRSVAGGQSLLPCLYEAARRRGLEFVPVFPLGGSARHLSYVAAAAAQDARGACIRYRSAGQLFHPGHTLSSLLRTTLEALHLSPTGADFVLDLEWLDPDVGVSMRSVIEDLNEASRVGPWRSFVLLGTSIPQTMGCVPEGSVHRIERQEWRLSDALPDTQLDRRPTFGDYGIQHPQPPHGTGGPSMRANIRYTVEQDTLVARGTGPVVREGRKQYYDLCERLVLRKEFLGPKFSWGDFIIAECAARQIEAGAQEMWRGAGTSHHLRFVTQQVCRTRVST